MKEKMEVIKPLLYTIIYKVISLYGLDLKQINFDRVNHFIVDVKKILRIIPIIREFLIAIDEEIFLNMILLLGDLCNEINNVSIVLLECYNYLE